MKVDDNRHFLRVKVSRFYVLISTLTQEKCNFCWNLIELSILADFYEASLFYNSVGIRKIFSASVTVPVYK